MTALILLALLLLSFAAGWSAATQRQDLQRRRLHAAKARLPRNLP